MNDQTRKLIEEKAKSKSHEHGQDLINAGHYANTATDRRIGYETGFYAGAEAHAELVEIQIQVLSVKLQRTVNAAYHALLEMSAWMGIPESKRAAQIESVMSNVRFCAEHDLRHMDEFNQVTELKSKLTTAETRVKELELANQALSKNNLSLGEEMDALKAKCEELHKFRCKDHEMLWDLQANCTKLEKERDEARAQCEKLAAAIKRNAEAAGQDWLECQVDLANALAEYRKGGA